MKLSSSYQDVFAKYILTDNSIIKEYLGTEAQYLHFLLRANGLSNLEAAFEASIEESTVKVHRQTIDKKLLGEVRKKDPSYVYALCNILQIALASGDIVNPYRCRKLLLQKMPTSEYESALPSTADTADANLVDSMLAVASKLPPRMREVFTLRGRGFTNVEIADEMGIMQSTVKVHVSQIMKRMQQSFPVNMSSAYLSTQMALICLAEGSNTPRYSAKNLLDEIAYYKQNPAGEFMDRRLCYKLITPWCTR